MRLPKVLILLALTTLLPACSTYSLQELKSVTPKGTPFQAALALKYRQYSEDQAARYDWVDSSYFADKGLAAAYGKDVLPEDFSRWNIPPERKSEMEQARTRLVSALYKNAGVASPQVAADAQYFFDCWMENQDEEWRADEIAYCRDGFEEAMNKLDGAVAPEYGASADAAEAGGSQAYIVFFGMNRDGLDEKGERMVDGVAKDLKDMKTQYRVTLNGHADRVGDARYNSELSRRRAEAVLAALVERGIPKEWVRAFGFGETDPKHATQDGVADAKNRRVEIFVGD